MKHRFPPRLVLTVLPLVLLSALLLSRNTLPPLVLPKAEMPNPNAHTLLIEARKSFPEMMGNVKLTTSKGYEDAPKLPLVTRQTYFATNDGIAKVRAALPHEYVQPLTYSFKQTFPEFPEFRQIARMLVLAGKTHADAGNNAEAVRCYLDAMELGVLIPHGNALIGYLVGVACESIGREITNKLDAATLHSALTRLEKIEARREPYYKSLERESHEVQADLRELFQARSLQEYYSLMVGEEGDARISNVSALGLQTLSFLYGRRVTVENSAYLMKKMVAHAQEPYSPNDMEIDKEISTFDLPNKILLPVFSGGNFCAHALQAENSLLRAYLAVRLYRLEKGKDPATLQDLVTAGYLKTLPEDGFSPTRAPIQYVGGKLYSVGPDAVDNQGSPIVYKTDSRQKRKSVSQDDEGDMVARVNTK
jgi:hypothetical protein